MTVMIYNCLWCVKQGQAIDVKRNCSSEGTQHVVVRKE